MKRWGLGISAILMGFFPFSAQSGSVDPELCAERVHEFIDVQASGGAEVFLDLTGQNDSSQNCKLEVERTHSGQKFVTELTFKPRARIRSGKELVIASLEGDDAFFDREVKKCELINDNELNVIVREENNMGWDRVSTFDFTLARDSYGVKEVRIVKRSGYKLLPQKEVLSATCRF